MKKLYTSYIICFISLLLLFLSIITPMFSYLVSIPILNFLDINDFPQQIHTNIYKIGFAISFPYIILMFLASYHSIKSFYHKVNDRKKLTIVLLVTSTLIILTLLLIFTKLYFTYLYQSPYFPSLGYS